MSETRIIAKLILLADYIGFDDFDYLHGVETSFSFLAVRGQGAHRISLKESETIPDKLILSANYVDNSSDFDKRFLKYDGPFGYVDICTSFHVDNDNVEELYEQLEYLNIKSEMYSIKLTIDENRFGSIKVFAESLID